MIQFSFQEYAPSLSAKSTATAIFKKIMELDPSRNQIEIDLSNMVAMTTICARVIFGGLYLKLGDTLFSQNIKYKGMSEAIKIVINWGIESAVENDLTSQSDQK